MNQSPTLGELAKALCKVQHGLQPVTKDNKVRAGQMNYSYADLPTVMAGCRELLSKNGVAVVQRFAPTDAGTVTLITSLLHESGEWMDSWLTLPVSQNTPQAYGSAISYARRYGLMAAVGIVADDDDDGHAASAPARNVNRTQVQTQSAPQAASEEWQTANRAVRAMLKKKGMAGASDEMRHQIAGDALGRTVNSFSDLTADELRTVYNYTRDSFPDVPEKALLDVPATATPNNAQLA